MQRLISSMLGAALACGPAGASAVEIIAHRGASFDAPENTLASVTLAWEQGADAVEVDLRLTADGRIVAMHDPTPQRYGGPMRVVAEMTWDELRRLDVGAWKDERWRGEAPPLLGELLATIPDGRRMFLEIKCGPEILPQLRRDLEAAGTRPEQIVLISFWDAVLAAAEEEIPELTRLKIVALKRDPQTGAVTPPLEDLVAMKDKLHVQGLDLGGDLSGVDEAWLARLREAGLPLYVWTVNDPAEAARLSGLGAVGVTTDKPAALRAGMASGTEP